MRGLQLCSNWGEEEGVKNSLSTDKICNREWMNRRLHRKVATGTTVAIQWWSGTLSWWWGLPQADNEKYERGIVLPYKNGSHRLKYFVLTPVQWIQVQEVRKTVTDGSVNGTGFPRKINGHRVWLQSWESRSDDRYILIFLYGVEVWPPRGDAGQRWKTANKQIWDGALMEALI